MKRVNGRMGGGGQIKTNSTYDDCDDDVMRARISRARVNEPSERANGQMRRKCGILFLLFCFNATSLINWILIQLWIMVFICFQFNSVSFKFRLFVFDSQLFTQINILMEFLIKFFKMKIKRLISNELN